MKIESLIAASVWFLAACDGPDGIKFNDPVTRSHDSTSTTTSSTSGEPQTVNVFFLFRKGSENGGSAGEGSGGSGGSGGSTASDIRSTTSSNTTTTVTTTSSDTESGTTTTESQFECEAGLTLCGDECVDLTQDVYNCWQCGNQCGLPLEVYGWRCNDGNCQDMGPWQYCADQGYILCWGPNGQFCC